MTIELNGKIKAIFELKKVSEKFSQKEIVITIDAGGNYPQHVSVFANNDKINLLDSIAIDDEVIAVVNINGREWVKDGVSKFFNTLTIFKLTKNESADKY